MSGKVKKKDPKLCGVCGDIALGSNFNAITCESCKAFFRRNALKTKDFKCPFENNCKVDIVTRRFCQKCRLKKCFSIGMRKEWILTDEEKKAKRDKIEKNRQKRSTHSDFPMINPMIKSEFIDDQEALSPVSSMSPLTPQTPGSFGLNADLPRNSPFSHQPLTPSDCEYSPPTKRQHIEGSIDSIQDSRLTDDSSIYCLSSPIDSQDKMSIASDISFEDQSLFQNEQENQVSKSSAHTSSSEESLPQSVFSKAVEIELTELPIRTSLEKSRELNEIEKQKLHELVVANEILKMPLICEKTDPSLVDVLNMTDHAIRRLIKMSKKISTFQNLCQQDQIALLKGSCTEMMILRSVMTYDPERECWRGPQGPKRMSIKVDILKEARGNIYEEHKRFITSFQPQWRTDENIMLILSAIALFAPDRPNIVHRDAIKLEQDTYYYLLSRYLESEYGFCESKSVYLKLIQKIQELHILNDNHVQVYMDVNPKDVEPLLIEIFDLKH